MIGLKLAWLLKNTAELRPNGRDAKVFRSEVFRDDEYSGSVNFAVSGRTLNSLRLTGMSSAELQDRLVRSLIAHVGWLIQTRRLPRTDNSTFEIRADDRNFELREQTDSQTADSAYLIPLHNFEFPPPSAVSAQSLAISNLFGFGTTQTLRLAPTLTVAVGENGSGKSSLRKLFRELSNISLGSRPFEGEPRWGHVAPFHAPSQELQPSLALKAGPYQYDAEFGGQDGASPKFNKERLLDADFSMFQRPDRGGFACAYEQRIGDNVNWHRRAEVAGPCDSDRSLLSELVSVWLYPSAASLQHFLAGVRTYSAWDFADAQTVARTDADITQGFLFRDGSNLKSVLGSLAAKGDKTFDSWFEHVMRNEPKLLAQGSTLRYIHSGRDFGVTELSDGSLRWAQVLAAVLSDSTMVVLDEPELGLHPDLIVSLAAFLKEQALRLQIVVFTHSKDLLSALDTMYRDDDETLHVQVLEQESGGNTIKTPDLTKLREVYPADEFSLGDLWARGLIGGNRW